MTRLVGAQFFREKSQSESRVDTTRMSAEYHMNIFGSNKNSYPALKNIINNPRQKSTQQQHLKFERESKCNIQDKA